MSPSHALPIKPGPRQAIVLIHGIGEQRPMETLRSFVGAFLDPSGYHSKPDTLSDSYELRRIKLRRASRCEGATEDINLEWPETDFYEYYWAHHMYGTTWSHVVSWFFRTLWRAVRFIGIAPTDYPRLRGLAALTWLLIPAALGAFGLAAWLLSIRPALRPTLPAAGAVALLLFFLQGALKYLPKTVLGAVLDFAGDAARYFDVNPKNVARRYDILRGGIALLKKLHEERDERSDEVMYRYGRIVLVGHSLGSVIAYDILRHYWSDVNGEIAVTDADVAKVEDYEGSNGRPSFPNAVPYPEVHRFWQAQYELWNVISARVPSGEGRSKDELWRRRHSSDEATDAAAPDREESPHDWRPARWLVSDLVTMGSPLAHAPVLLADGPCDLKSKIELRELPTCPPDRSRHLRPGHFVVDLSAEADRFNKYRILHHGACFALTRWTNFWYPNDPVGGPLCTPCGSGINDVRLENISVWPVKSHVSYWRRGLKLDYARSLKDILVGAQGRLLCPLIPTDRPGAQDSTNPQGAAVG